MQASRDGRSPGLRHSRLTAALAAVLVVGAAIAVVLPAGAGGNRRALRDVHATKTFWHQTTLKRAIAKAPSLPTLRFRTSVKPYRLDLGSMRHALAKTPWERTRAARLHPTVVTLPAPNGAFQRFAVQRTAIMAPALQAKHPEIATYSGFGIDDPGATIALDTSPFGLHASVRSTNGGWYIDPYFRKNASYYVYVGGPAAVTAAKVALINRVDQPYGQDLSIRMQLIGNNDLLNLNTWAA